MDKRGLAAEAAAEFTDKSGCKLMSRTIGGVEITDVRITRPQNGFEKGRYITLSGEPHAPEMTYLFRRALLQLIPDKGRLFAVGLGNPDITYDRLGAAVIRSVAARTGRRYSLCAIEADVAARTGIDSARVVRAAAREANADCVIAFDSLSCVQPGGLGRTVQLSDAGIIPASGISHNGSGKMPLTAETLGVPIVAVGVPLVTVLSSVTKNSADTGYHISRADVDVLVKIWAEVIGGALDGIVG